MSHQQITDEIYRLFDRHCCIATALAKPAALRKRVQRFTKSSRNLKGLFVVNAEKDGVTRIKKDKKRFNAKSADLWVRASNADDAD
jgi:hypothetical protein